MVELKGGGTISTIDETLTAEDRGGGSSIPRSDYDQKIFEARGKEIAELRAEQARAPDVVNSGDIKASVTSKQDFKPAVHYVNDPAVMKAAGFVNDAAYEVAKPGGISRKDAEKWIGQNAPAGMGEGDRKAFASAMHEAPDRDAFIQRLAEEGAARKGGVVTPTDINAGRAIAKLNNISNDETARNLGAFVGSIASQGVEKERPQAPGLSADALAALQAGQEELEQEYATRNATAIVPSGP